jgi:predicted deacylase
MVGVPVLGLLGILEAGRSIPAPLSVGGDWALESDPTANCANPPGSLQRQLAWSISQSGAEAVITLHDGYGTTLEAAIDGATLTAKSPGGAILATVAGKLDQRTMEGKVTLVGCAPVAFHAVRQASRNRSE